MSEYVSGVEDFLSELRDPPLSTGSSELDDLIGGVKNGMFYFFYCKEKELIENLFQHLVVNALKPNKEGLPLVVYMLCGNYRKERTNLGLEELAELVEDSGFYMWEALKRVHIFTASSADQQALLVDGLIKLLEKESNVSLVIVRGIYKLQLDDARVKNRQVVSEEVQRSIIHLKQICARRNIPLVTSGRDVKMKDTVMPQPESSSFLRHTANAVIYLQRREKGSAWNWALLVDHPTRPPGSVEYRLMVKEELGRETKPFRMSFQEMVEKLRQEIKQPLVKKDRKAAFERLIEAWGTELGAMSYAESFKMIDLSLLISVIENRRLHEEAQRKLQFIESRLERLENRA